MGKNKGLLHIYTGDGKGKTTAAVGLSVRAVGAGMQVLFAQFMKNGDSSEIGPLESLGVDVLYKSGSGRFVFAMGEEERREYARRQQALFEEVQASVRDKGYQMLVLDEIASALSTGMLPEPLLAAFMETRPDDLEVIMTGRGFSETVLAQADYISDIRAVRHPYERGAPARRGIEC